MFSRIKFIKLCDGLFGTVFLSVATFLIKPKFEIKKNPSKFLIIRPGGIGDAVLLFPALKTLKENYPNSQIDVLAEKRNSDVFKFCCYVDNLFLYDSLNFFTIFQRTYDLVIDTEQWHKLSSVIGYLTKAPQRIGFNTNNRAKLHTTSVDYSQKDYEVNSFLNLVSVVCNKVAEFNPNEQFIKLRKNETFLGTLKTSNQVKVGIFFGATVNERKWGIENFSRLTNKLIEKGFAVIVLGGKADKADMNHYSSQITKKDNLIDLVGKTSLEETACVISKLDVLVSGDSGLMHLAYALGIKTVSLFGAGIEKKWAPKSLGSTAINKNLRCSPCTEFGYTPKCPYNVKCLRKISVEETLFNVLKSLGSKI